MSNDAVGAVFLIKSKVIEGGSIQSQVYRELREDIIQARFNPGEVISIRKEAARLGTSPMPVRESFKQLVSDNALEVLPNKSFRLPILNAERTLDIYRLRVLLEGNAVALSTQNITAADIAMLKRITNKVTAAQANKDIENMAALNREFHFVLYQRCGSDLLIQFIESLWMQFSPTLAYAYRTLFKLGDGSQFLSWESHAEILQAVEVKDSKAAKKALEKDLTGFYNKRKWWLRDETESTKGHLSEAMPK